MGKCFHSLILTTYNPTLPVITEKKHSITAQKSLAQALLVGGPIRTEGICEYVVVNITPKK